MQNSRPIPIRPRSIAIISGALNITEATSSILKREISFSLCPFPVNTLSSSLLPYIRFSITLSNCSLLTITSSYSINFLCSEVYRGPFNIFQLVQALSFLPRTPRRTYLLFLYFLFQHCTNLPDSGLHTQFPISIYRQRL